MLFVNWDTIKEAAIHQFGKPYLFGAKPAISDPNPTNFDCSGFVRWVFGQGGIILPEGSQDQFDLTIPLTNTLQFGDVGFFKVEGQPTHHVGILLNKYEIIEARGFEPTLEAAGIKTNCILIRPREKWEAWKEFTGWRRFIPVLP